MTRAARAVAIAAMIWGSLPGCHSVHQRFATLQRGALGEAINPCTILYNRRQRWPWGKFCTVTIHEYGHLAGHGHSRNPRSVMYYRYTHDDRRCYRD